MNSQAQIPPEDHQFVIAEITIKFIAEMHYPGDADIFTGIVRIGNSSLQLQQELRVDGDLKSTATSVVVMIDERTRKSAPFDARTKDYLTQFFMKA